MTLSRTTQPEASDEFDRLRAMWPYPDGAKTVWVEVMMALPRVDVVAAVDHLLRTARRRPTPGDLETAAREHGRSWRPAATGGRMSCGLCDPIGWVLLPDDTMHGTARPCPNGCKPLAHGEHDASERPAGRANPEAVAAIIDGMRSHPASAATGRGGRGAHVSPARRSGVLPEIDTPAGTSDRIDSEIGSAGHTAPDHDDPLVF